MLLKTVTIIMSVFLLAGCTSPATSRSTNSPKPASTSTPVNSDILYFDDFSDPQSGWWVGEDESGKAFYSDGKYHLLMYKGDMGNCANTNETYSDGVINLEIQHLSGDQESEAGIIFRDNENGNGYVFLLTRDGNFHLEKYVNNSPTSLLQVNNSDRILVGTRTNKITISMHNRNFYFFINDTHIGSVEDSSFSSGDVGLCVFPGASSDAEYAFDNFVVYKYDPLNVDTPQTPEYTPTPVFTAITWMELADFLARDHTNWNQYNPNNYVCIDFAIDLVEKARKENIKAWIVGVDFANGELGHAFVAFETSDKGIRYVEPQEDYTYSNLAVGTNLCDDWGQAECMGVVANIEHYWECDHDHYCIDYKP